MYSVDKDINEIFDEMEKQSLDEIYKHIKDKFLLDNLLVRNSMIAYFKKYHFWGEIDILKNNYDNLKRRAESFKNHLEDYRWLYNKLGDYRSKLTLFGVVNSLYNLNYDSLEKVIEKSYKQYYDFDLVKCDKKEVFVDLGAYNGDTAVSYINQYGPNNYKKIYCYEMSPDAFEVLKNNLSGYKNVVCINKAVSDKNGSTNFTINSTSASANSLSNEGNENIETITLDDDIKEKITMIKMDIEGAEQAAINGCKNHIKNDTPKLLISVYHNFEDLYKIPRMIYDLNKNYNYYLRYYGTKYFPTELIFFAIPKKTKKKNS